MKGRASLPRAAQRRRCALSRGRKRNGGGIVARVVQQADLDAVELARVVVEPDGETELHAVDLVVAADAHPPQQRRAHARAAHRQALHLLGHHREAGGAQPAGPAIADHRQAAEVDAVEAVVRHRGEAAGGEPGGAAVGHGREAAQADPLHPVVGHEREAAEAQPADEPVGDGGEPRGVDAGHPLVADHREAGDVDAAHRAVGDDGEPRGVQPGDGVVADHREAGEVDAAHAAVGDARQAGGAQAGGLLVADHGEAAEGQPAEDARLRGHQAQRGAVHDQVGVLAGPPERQVEAVDALHARVRPVDAQPGGAPGVAEAQARAADGEVEALGERGSGGEHQRQQECRAASGHGRSGSRVGGLDGQRPYARGAAKVSHNVARPAPGGERGAGRGARALSGRPRPRPRPAPCA